MIPETDFCAPYFMSKNTTYIEECVNADQAKCSGECKWRKGKVVAANNDLINGADFFGANFCHPTMESWKENLQKCITVTNKDACTQAKCMWSTGKEFQKEDDFCHPRQIPDTAAAFDACTNMKYETTCPVANCQWFKGTPLPTTCPFAPSSDMPTWMCGTAGTISPAWNTRYCKYECPTTCATPTSDNTIKCSTKSYWDNQSCMWSCAPEYVCQSKVAPAIATADSCKVIDNYDGCMNLQDKCEWTELFPDTQPVLPVTGFCKWTATAGSATASANPCNVYVDDKACNAVTTGECKWEMMNTGGNTGNNGTPMFGDDFCHPATVSSKSTAGEWAKCIDQTTAPTCAIATGCNWSNG